MAFYGLFIGIDRYESSAINWLACARQDAVALHALFQDTFGGNPTLLTDKNASYQEIQKAFNSLNLVKQEDLVVITFSGHGSDTHGLVAYNSIYNKLETTGVPLKILNSWLEKIPSKRLLLVLDCCFSGGMGAKGITSEVKARDITSIDERLTQISGEGRVIFTASAPNELAFENQQLGHGLLSYYLMEALQGAEEVRTQGKIDTYDLLKYVTNRVVDKSTKMGKPQHPTLRGSIDGSFEWPVFVIGDHYRTMFPERIFAPVTTDITSLESYGYPKDLIKKWAGAIPGLNDLQLAAINDFDLLQNKHLVVSAPTSSGKTMIGELAALKGALERKRALFLFPLKALVNDKHRSFINLYDPYGLEIIRATGDSNDEVPELLSGRYDICLLTYEKFTSLLLANPYILDCVGTVVIDEVQMIADPSRGTNLEFILTLLQMRRSTGISPQLIALSAVIGNTQGLERWLDARLLYRTERPVPLDEGILNGAGNYKYIESDSGVEKSQNNYVSRVFRKGGSQEWIIPLVQRLVSEGKQVIVFREKKGETRGAAIYLSENLGLPPADRALNALPSGDPSLINSSLRTSLSGGVALHNADLDRDERRIVEEYFREPESQIRVIVATTTLAMGVNTPAEAVIVAGLNHPGQIPTPYTVAEYKNIVGRAGRLGYAKRGQSFVLTLSQHSEHDIWHRYILGKPEELISRFFQIGTDYRSLIIRVLASARSASGQNLKGMKAEEIIAFLANSFGAFQEKQRNENWDLEEDKFKNALSNLEQHSLVKDSNNGTYQLTELGWIAGQAGVEVESINRLIDVIRNVPADSVNEPTLLGATQITCELDALYIYVNSRGAPKEKQTWSQELSHQLVASNVISQLINSSEDTYQAAARLKRVAACLLWISEYPMNHIEEILTKHGGRYDGAAGPVRSISSRTNDLISIVIRVAELIHPSLDLSNSLSTLPIRLDAGVSPHIFEIARCLGSQLSRADYHSLMAANIYTVDHLVNATDDEILRLLSNDQFKLKMIKKSIKSLGKDIDRSELEPPLLPKYEL